jgi:hypothetical protein
MRQVSRMKGHGDTVSMSSNADDGIVARQGLASLGFPHVYDLAVLKLLQHAQELFLGYVPHL